MQGRSILAASAVSVLLGVNISSASAASNVMACDGQLAAVSGGASTMNISPTQQIGQISIVLSPLSGGAPIFADANGLVQGEIQNQSRVRTLLNHEMQFSNGDTLSTKNDMAILKMPPIGFEADGTPCAFEVFESIYNVSGTGLFEGANASISAEGTISFCSYNNSNNFSLSGLVCLAN